MTEPPPEPYRVSYSGRVRDALRELIDRAGELRPEVVAAAREIDRRFHVYPQFGQPLRDLSIEPARLWIGVVAPLVVQYVLDEERRLVMVVLPMMPLPDSGL